ncbi:MAG: two-component sensor histidine kinase [Betaproteobacteria bacterium]|nr:two-component sensor histidine kinase [Betaproteobacteria bacterium]
MSEASAHNSVRRDFYWAAAAAIGVILISIRYELSETLLAWTRPWERYQLDELPVILLFIALALAWFAWRRMREAQAELARRVAVEKELATALAGNQRLSQSHVQVQEEERRNLARELHDELGQHLNAIKIDAVSIRDAHDGEAAAVRQSAEAIIGIADHVHGVVRDMTRKLRPAGLDELGLPAALENFVEGWRVRFPALQFNCVMTGDLEKLSELLNITLYRVAQEGLTNIAKHANANRVDLSVMRNSASAQADELVLSLADDGVGVAPGQAHAGLGLIGMRERVEAAGGRLETVSTPGRGFRLVARVPVQAA